MQFVVFKINGFIFHTAYQVIISTNHMYKVINSWKIAAQGVYLGINLLSV